MSQKLVISQQYTTIHIFTAQNNEFCHTLTFTSIFTDLYKLVMAARINLHNISQFDNFSSWNIYAKNCTIATRHVLVRALQK
jgi:hypothetical protein